MPRGDRTGPEGMGPMTGRGAGNCADGNAQDYANPLPGTGSVAARPVGVWPRLGLALRRGLRRGLGRGVGRGAGRGQGRGRR